MMTQQALDDWETPITAAFGPVELTGLSERYSEATCDAIPAQWGRFAPLLAQIPGRMGWVTYGVCSNSDTAGEMDYLCAVQVAEGSTPLPGFTTLTLPRRGYAVIQHRGHISSLRATWQYARKKWAPAAGVRFSDAPEFERYTESFDPETGMGGLEIWIPLAEE